MTDEATRHAAAVLHTIQDRQSTVRLYTERGGLPDAMAIVVAQGLGVFADPWRVDYSTTRIVAGMLSLLVAVGMTTLFMRHRRNLGGMVGGPTWMLAAVVFVGNVIAYQTMSGDARELARAALLGAALIGLGLVYRSALLLLIGGMAACGLPAGTLAWPVAAAWFIPMALWIAVVGYVGRRQLREQLTI
jgi:hypothetical protein